MTDTRNLARRLGCQEYSGHMPWTSSSRWIPSANGFQWLPRLNSHRRRHPYYPGLQTDAMQRSFEVPLKYGHLYGMLSSIWWCFQTLAGWITIDCRWRYQPTLWPPPCTNSRDYHTVSASHTTEPYKPPFIMTDVWQYLWKGTTWGQISILSFAYDLNALFFLFTMHFTALR